MAVVTVRELYSRFTSNLVLLQSASKFRFLRHVTGARILSFKMSPRPDISNEVKNSER
jgi:hypothetical protein